MWKSQGLTIDGLLAFQLGETEKEHGVTFVGLSRSTNIKNVSVCGGCSLERLTTKISRGTKLKLRLKEDERLDVLHAKALLHFHSSNNLLMLSISFLFFRIILHLFLYFYL